MDIRKTQSKLTPAQIADFVNAVLKLKLEVPSQMGLASRYDDYVQIHMDSMMLPNGQMRMPGWAHQGPAFGPWHRALLRRFELDLQAAVPGVTLPYWDWTVDNTATGSPWTDTFLGAMDGATDDVTTGPFRKGVWKVTVRETGDIVDNLKRALGRATYQQQEGSTAVSTLPTTTNVTGALAEVPYDRSRWKAGDSPSFRDRLEGWHGAGSIHNRVHLWVGGSMLPSTSPNDPIFFMHHCNVDRLWAEWQRKHPDQGYAPGDSVADAPMGHKLDDPMQPWGGSVTVKSCLDVEGLGYSYDTIAPAISPHLHATLPVEKVSVSRKIFVIPEWTYQEKPIAGARRSMHHMFRLSPEDRAAGGHDLGK